MSALWTKNCVNISAITNSVASRGSNERSAEWSEVIVRSFLVNINKKGAPKPSGHWHGVVYSCCFCRAPVFSSPRGRDWKWLGIYPSDRTATAENIRRGGGERACSTARDRHESVDWSGSQTISCKSKCSYILICFPLAQKERVRVEIVTHCH